MIIITHVLKQPLNIIYSYTRISYTVIQYIVIQYILLYNTVYSYTVIYSYYINVFPSHFSPIS